MLTTQMYFVQDIMVNLTTMVKEALVNFYRTTGFKPHRSISRVSMHMRNIHIIRVGIICRGVVLHPPIAPRLILLFHLHHLQSF